VLSEEVRKISPLCYSPLMPKGNSEEIAASIVHLLVKAGYIAYFAGGCVRDKILGRPAEDWDIATDATPEEVAALFPHTVPLGAEFGSTIVVIDGRPTEVTTFRSDIHDDYENGRRPHRIEKATPEEDALRRSFTINGMFFDPLREEIIDYVGGRQDLKLGIVRAIGDPDLRFKEDRLRMIRAVRFTARFHFQLEEKTRQAIAGHAHLLFPAVSMERVWQELQKMAAHSHFDEALVLMHDLGLLQEIFPKLRGTGLSEIRRQVEPFHRFPAETSLVVFLLELFPTLSAGERRIAIGRLKPSNADLALAESLSQGEELLRRQAGGSNPPDRVEWVNFYAEPTRTLSLDIAAAHLPLEESKALLEWHQKQYEELLPHIERRVEKRPLVTSAHLKERGVAPGKRMGELLKIAEQVAILHDLHDPETVLSRIGL
jgi:poly(A) polymerase